MPGLCHSRKSYLPVFIEPHPVAPPLTPLAWSVWSHFGRVGLGPIIEREAAPPSRLPQSWCRQAPPPPADVQQRPDPQPPLSCLPAGSQLCQPPSGRLPEYWAFRLEEVGPLDLVVQVPWLVGLVATPLFLTTLLGTPHHHQAGKGLEHRSQATQVPAPAW